ncbi:UDP-Glycosyltransferase/glycogen phosphorylase [Cubamyces sp. BRFM 1775]|nr:UDP-Glycosyltransferase/glycogen phosphorylase [Cubamyces sp. BRFM 1775]
MTISTQRHIVAFPFQAWGHCRPLITLAARFVKLRPVYVTFLTTNQVYEKVQAELARNFESGEEAVISIDEGQFLTSDATNAGFKTTWAKLIVGEELVCAKAGITYSALPKPQAAIVDFFGVVTVATIKELSGDTVKVYSWHPGSTFAAFYLFGPEKLGGKGDVGTKAEIEAKRTGRPYEEVVKELFFTPKGEVVKVPGLPPMYDYEYHPQDFPIPEEVGIHIFPRVYETLRSCNGVILFTPESYEPEAVAAVRAWKAETGHKAYVCGPLIPTGSQAAANEKKQSTETAEIEAFLETTLKTSGEKSLLYISFGSIFWPVKTPEKLWAFLDVVIERNIPFILSHASPFAGSIPDAVKEKVKLYGKGLLSPWTPQQTILEHPATGWFVAHGGHNGVTEAISAGVPLIFWPFGGDQPLNAIHMTDNLNVAYELIEVRTGPGLHPIYRNGRKPVGTVDAVKDEAREVLAKAFGEDGAQKRENLKALTHALRHEWEEGGSSLRDMTAFLDSL